MDDSRLYIRLGIDPDSTAVGLWLFVMEEVPVWVAPIIGLAFVRLQFKNWLSHNAVLALVLLYLPAAFAFEFYAGLTVACALGDCL